MERFSKVVLVVGFALLVVGGIALLIAAPWSVAGYAALTTTGVGTGVVVGEAVDYATDQRDQRERSEREDLKEEVRAEVIEELRRGTVSPVAEEDSAPPSLRISATRGSKLVDGEANRTQKELAETDPFRTDKMPGFRRYATGLVVRPRPGETPQQTAVRVRDVLGAREIETQESNAEAFGIVGSFPPRRAR